MSLLTDRRDLYPSRTAGRPAILPRQDPVVWGDDPGPLDPELVASYEEHGYLVLPGLLPPSTVRSLDVEIERLAADEAVKEEPRAVIEPDGRALRSLFRIHAGDDALGELARDPKLVGIARQLLGEDVYVHQSRVNLKPGLHGKEFYWHSDFETWHAEDGMPAMRAVSCSIALTDNYSYNGSLMLMPGSHRVFYPCVGATPDNHHRASLVRQDIGVPSREVLTEAAHRFGISQFTGPAGTALWFDCNIMHGSGSNITPFPRSNVFLVFNSVDNALTEPFAAARPRPEFLAARPKALVGG